MLLTQDVPERAMPVKKIPLFAALFAPFRGITLGKIILSGSRTSPSFFIKLRRL